MQYKRLTNMNQYGDILYIGDFKKNTYRNMGDYPESIVHSTDNVYKEKVINEILSRLYYFEESLEDTMENLNKCKQVI